MNKAKNKTVKVASNKMTRELPATWKEMAPTYSDMAIELMNSFIEKGFTTEQSFNLTSIVMTKLLD